MRQALKCISNNFLCFDLEDCYEDRWLRKEILKQGNYLESNNKNVRLLLSTIGELEILLEKRRLWSKGNNSANYLLLNNTGNILLHGNNNDLLWKVNTRGELLIIQDDSNLVLYDQCGYPVWSSQTSTFNRHLKVCLFIRNFFGIACSYFSVFQLLSFTFPELLKCCKFAEI